MAYACMLYMHVDMYMCEEGALYPRIERVLTSTFTRWASRTPWEG